MNAENHESNPAYAWDGGMVQMSLNGGAWTQITPVGGYLIGLITILASPSQVIPMFILEALMDRSCV
jgi:hypothetical protein